MSREQRLTLIATILGSTVVFLDATVINVALPAIADGLGAGLAGQQWVVEAYLLTMVSLMLVGGSLGDQLGRRRVYLVGLVAFAVTSALCAVPPSARAARAGAPLGPPAERAVAEAKEQPLGVPKTAALPPRQASAVRATAVDASTSAFHLGLLIAALLMIAGGIASGVGIEAPRRGRLSFEPDSGRKDDHAPEEPVAATPGDGGRA